MDMNHLAAQIIAYAGDSQSYSLEAIELAKKLKFEEANEKLESARESSLIAHKYHTELIAMGARDETLKINLLVVHASNHFSTAEMLIHLAESFCDLRKEIEKKC